MNDASISRRHALIRPSGDVLEIEDLGSVNGTIVNGSRITAATQLRNGDVIELGGTALTVGVDAPTDTVVLTRSKSANDTVVAARPPAAVVAPPERPEPAQTPPPAAPALEPSLAPAAVESVLLFAPVAPRKRGIASRRLAPTVYTITVIVATAIALIVYFAVR